MATASDLIEETLDLFYQEHRPQLNVLASGVDASTSTITFTYAMGGIVSGAHIEIDTEVMYVLDATGQSATVLRGRRGSTAAVHATGAVVVVNPKVARNTVFRSLNEELHALYAEGLYQMVPVELTYNPAVQGYNLTGVTDLNDIYSVSYDTPGPEQSWPELRPTEYRLVRNAETDDFASGYAVVLYHGGNPGRQLRVLYKAPFTQFATTASTTTAAGLPDSAVDLLPLGVVLRFGSFREWSRNFFTSQGDTRRANEVPMGAQVTASRLSMQYRQMRVAAEVTKLNARYPTILR